MQSLCVIKRWWYATTYSINLQWWFQCSRLMLPSESFLNLILSLKFDDIYENQNINDKKELIKELLQQLIQAN